MNTNLIRRKPQLPAIPNKLMLQLAGTLAGVNGGETASPCAVEPWSGWVGEKMVKSWAKAGQKLSKLAMALLQEILLDEKRQCQQLPFYPLIFSSNPIPFHSLCHPPCH